MTHFPNSVTTTAGGKAPLPPTIILTTHQQKAGRTKNWRDSHLLPPFSSLEVYKSKPAKAHGVKAATERRIGGMWCLLINCSQQRRSWLLAGHFPVVEEGCVCLPHHSSLIIRRQREKRGVGAAYSFLFHTSFDKYPPVPPSELSPSPPQEASSLFAAYAAGEVAYPHTREKRIILSSLVRRLLVLSLLLRINGYYYA